MNGHCWSGGFPDGVGSVGGCPLISTVDFVVTAHGRSFLPCQRFNSGSTNSPSDFETPCKAPGIVAFRVVRRVERGAVVKHQHHACTVPHELLTLVGIEVADLDDPPVQQPLAGHRIAGGQGRGSWLDCGRFAMLGFSFRWFLGLLERGPLLLDEIVGVLQLDLGGRDEHRSTAELAHTRFRAGVGVGQRPALIGLEPLEELLDEPCRVIGVAMVRRGATDLRGRRALSSSSRKRTQSPARHSGNRSPGCRAESVDR